MLWLPLPFLVLLAGALAAQGSPCPPAGDTTTLALSAVDERPIADSAKRWPWYPDLLVAASIGGPVRVTYVVDTAGRPGSIAIVRSASPGFDMSVKRAVATWRYTAARRCGRAVRVRLSYQFVFQPSSTDTTRVAQLFKDTSFSTQATTDTLEDGTPRTTIRVGLPPSLSTTVTWDAAALDSAEDIALAEIIRSIGPDSAGLTRVVCLMGPGGAKSDPAGERLARLTQPGTVVLAFRRCPPTLATPIARPSARPSPPGDDPYALHVVKRTEPSAARAVVDVDALHGTGGVHYLCGVERRSEGWRVRCTTTRGWVS